MRYVDPDGNSISIGIAIVFSAAFLASYYSVLPIIKNNIQQTNKNSINLINVNSSKLSKEESASDIGQRLKKSAQTTTSAPMQEPDDEPNESDDTSNLEYESNPKHHQNARGKSSQEPNNAKQMFEKSVKDPKKDDTRWYKDKHGNFHRFKEHQNGKYHWNGSTNTGTKMDNVPIELRRNLPLGEL